VGPRLLVPVGCFEGDGGGPESGRDRKDLSPRPTPRLESSRKRRGVESTELSRFVSTSRLHRESFPARPEFQGRNGGTEEASEGGRGKATEISGSLARSGDYLEREEPSRCREGLRFAEQSFALRAGKTEGISQDGHVRKGPRGERGSDPIAPDSMGWRSWGHVDPEQHLPRQVEGDSLRSGRADLRKEATGTGSDVHGPGARRDVSAQETDPELAEQFALGGPLVPQPFPVRSVGVQRLEPFPGRSGTFRPRGRGGPAGAVAPAGSAEDRPSPRPSRASPLLPTTFAPLEVDPLPYYECPKCGGGYVIDVPPSARPTCDRDGARLKRASDASYEKNARRD
jgi:hypothetical protein